MLSQTSSVTQKKKKTLNDFEIIDQNNATKPDLGRGTYSNVKLVKEKANPRKSYAMKIVILMRKGFSYSFFISSIRNS